MKKFIYLFKNGDQKTRITTLIAIAAVALAFLMLILSVNSALNGPITKIPLVKIFVPEYELDALEERYEDLVDEVEDAIDDDDDYVIDEIEDIYDMSAKEFLKLINRPLSINLVRKLAKLEARDPEATLMFTIITTIITIQAIIVGVLIALAGLLMNKPLIIVANAISIAFFAFVVGAVWLILLTAFCIAYAVLVSILKKTYKEYKNAPVEAPATEQVATDEI